jgi:hypothetical protein
VNDEECKEDHKKLLFDLLKCRGAQLIIKALCQETNFPPAAGKQHFFHLQSNADPHVHHMSFPDSLFQ